MSGLTKKDTRVVDQRDPLKSLSYHPKIVFSLAFYLVIFFIV